MAAPDAILLARLAVERGLAAPAAAETALGQIGVEGDAAALEAVLAAAGPAETRERIAGLAAAARDAAGRQLIGDLRRFGALAVESGLCTGAALASALEAQASLRARGMAKRVGTLLVARGDMPPGAVRQVLAAQGAAIFGCDACGARFNVLGPKGARPDCPLCQAGLSSTQPGDSVEVEGTLVAAAAAARKGTPAPAVRTRTRDVRAAATAGRPFAGYVIDQEIARGGMGIVYRAHQPNLDRAVALKVLLAGEGASEEMVARLYAEAEAAARLRHPNIVTVHDVGRFEQSHYICMDYIEGEPLDALLARQGHLSPKRAAQIALDLARALHYAHGQGIVHRDLKPANVILQGDGRPVLTDFGLAKDLVADRGLTTGGTVLGTPDYMSPEQARGHSRKIDARSDVFGLGALLYHMLAGEAPFAAKTPMKTMHNVVALDPAPPSQQNPAVPRELDAVCRQALEKRPADRYSDAGALAADLERWLAGEPVRAAPPGPWRDAWRRWTRDRRLRQTAVVAAGAMVLGSIVTAAWMRGGRPAGPPPPGPPTPSGPTADPEAASVRGKLVEHLAAAARHEQAARDAAPDDHDARVRSLRAAYQDWHALESVLAQSELARQLAGRDKDLRPVRDAAERKTRLRKTLADEHVALAASRGAEATWDEEAWARAQQDLDRAIEYQEGHPAAFALRAWLRALRASRAAAPAESREWAHVEFDVGKARATSDPSPTALAAGVLADMHRRDPRAALAVGERAARDAPPDPAIAFATGLAAFLATAKAPPDRALLLERAIVLLDAARETWVAAGQSIYAAHASVALAKALDQAGRRDDALAVLDRYLHGEAAQATHLLALEARHIRAWMNKEQRRTQLAIDDLEFIERADDRHAAMALLRELRGR